MSEQEKRETSLKKMYETILNGYVDFAKSGKNLLERCQVTYCNSKTGKMQTQSYFAMEDIVVPVIIRKSENGFLDFAMLYEYIPAVDKVFLELPECPFFDIKKPHYTNNEVLKAVENRLHGLDLSNIGIKYLDSSETAVSQSFTDQQAKFVAVYVEELKQNYNLHWFPVSSIPDFFAKIQDNSSLQTKYALQLFYEQYKDEILKNKPTQFIYDTQIVGQSIGKWMDEKTIMEHKYRFGIKMAENKQFQDENEMVSDFGQIAEYGVSKNSSNCLIVKKQDGKTLIGLSKQLRSPFIGREGTDSYFYEFVGGMLEDGETYLKAAMRETLEETGVDIQDLKLIHIETPTLSSKAASEYGDFYLCEIKDQTKINSQILDEQEDINVIEWFDLFAIDLEKIHIPLATKYIIEKTRQFYTDQREKQHVFRKQENESSESKCEKESENER